jgi:hypothetical protein
MAINGHSLDLFDEYFYLREDTEPPAVFHRWSLIGCIGAWLGRQVWLPFGSQRIFPNQYIMFIGTPGSRKSTAINMARVLIDGCGYDTYAADKTSKEKFLIDLSGQDIDLSPRATRGKSADDILEQFNVLDIHDGIPKEVFIVADEFNDFMGNANIEFQSLLGRFWDWDKESAPYSHRLKNSKAVEIYQPTVNILSGNTPQGFADCFPLASIGQGFMSRLILIHGEPSGKKFSDPPEPSKPLTEKLMAHFYAMRSKVKGPMKKTPEAASTLDTLYRSWPELDDSRFSHYSTRRYTHLLKLCVIFAAARLSTEITRRDVIYANTVLAYAETNMPKAIGELGTSRMSQASNKLMQFLYEARQPKTHHELFKVVRNDLENPRHMTDLLINLTMADKIQVITLPDSNGKVAYLPKRDLISRKVMFVDHGYLKGRELL